MKIGITHNKFLSKKDALEVAKQFIKNIKERPSDDLFVCAYVDFTSGNIFMQLAKP